MQVINQRYLKLSIELIFDNGLFDRVIKNQGIVSKQVCSFEANLC